MGLAEVPSPAVSSGGGARALQASQCVRSSRHHACGVPGTGGSLHSYLDGWVSPLRARLCPVSWVMLCPAPRPPSCPVRTQWRHAAGSEASLMAVAAGPSPQLRSVPREQSGEVPCEAQEGVQGPGAGKGRAVLSPCDLRAGGERGHVAVPLPSPPHPVPPPPLVPLAAAGQRLQEGGPKRRVSGCYTSRSQADPGR